MTKGLIFICSALLIITSLISLAVHGPEMGYILGLSKLWVIGRLALAGFLMVYYLFWPVRRRGVSSLMRLTGIILLYAGLSSVLWGSYGSGTFIPVVDIVLVLESGIVALLASMELPQHEKAVVDLASLKLSVLAAMQSGRKGRLPAITTD